MKSSSLQHNIPRSFYLVLVFWNLLQGFLFFQPALLYVIVVKRTSLKKSVDFVRLLLFLSVACMKRMKRAR